MQIKEVDVEKTEIFSIGRQYSHNVLVIHFVNLPNLKNKYIYYKIDDIEEEIPLVSDLFIVSRPLTMHSGKVKAQIIVRDEANETIDLTKNFTMIIKASNYSGIGEDENYPDDLNVKNYFVKIDEKVNSFEELANLVQTKLDNGEFIGAQGPKGDPGDVTEEYRNLAMQIAQNASDAQTSATNAQTSASNAQRILNDTKEFANQTKSEMNQIKNDTELLKNEANTSAVNAKASENKAKEYADNLQASTDDISKLKEDIVNQKKEIDGLKLIVKKYGPITDMTWSRIQQIVANGSGSDAFEIGAHFIEKWTDTADSKEYDMPWQVNHFEDMTLEDGEVVPGMWLQTHYTLPFGIQFSHQRAFLACPDGLSAGTYNFDFAKTWGGNVKPGINYQFTLTKPVEKGGRLAGCYGAPGQVPSNWKVYSYGKDGITLNETVNVTVGSGGTNLGTIPYDSRSGNLNSVQEMAYGWNRWRTSALRQWLNSSKPKGQWWTPQDQWDICPDQLASKDGFLCGMPDEMLNCLKKVKVVTYANTVNDEGAEDITYDYVTLPSLSQMFIKPQTSGEGDVHTYWKRRSGRTTPCEWRTDYPNMVEYSVANKTSPQYVRLRSVYQGVACRTWHVGASGGVDGSSASGANTFAPLVCIA